MNIMYDSSVAKSWTQLSKELSVDLSQEFQLGKLGSVYRAFSFLRNQMVYMKVLPKDKASQRYIETLQQHIDLDHPYVLGYYGYLQKEDQIYLLFQYCSSHTLQKLIQNRLSQTEVLRLFRQLLEGLQYLHSEKRLLKELRPQNILIGWQEDIKLCQIPCFPPKSKKEVQEWETAIYGAPQLLLSQHQSIDQERAQLWTVGIVVYQMLSNQTLFQKISNYDSLKSQWLNFERCLNINLLTDKYHPIWNSLLNSILTFSVESRPTFGQLLESIALLYKPLSSELSQPKQTFTAQVNNLYSYCRYNLSKYDFLLSLCESFTCRDIRLCNEFKYLIMFCCIMRYLSFQKSFVEKIKNRHIVINHQNLIYEQGKNHSFIRVILKQAQVIVRQKSLFYQHQIHNNIIPKIIQTYCERSQSQFIINDLRSIVELVRSVQKGTSCYQEQQYEEGFKLILGAIERRHGDVTKYYDLQQLKIYHNVLNAMLLSEIYPQEKFHEWNLLEKQSVALESMDRDQLIHKILGLANQIF